MIAESETKSLFWLRLVTFGFLFLATTNLPIASHGERVYLTTDPIFFALGSVLIFVICTLIFVTFDVVVERRQRKVMRTAKQSSAIVSSLFPASLPPLLYDPQTEGNYSPPRSQIQMLKRLLTNGPTQLGTAGDSMPIADLFPNTTVMYADIVGFNEWSSHRQVSQVFNLLERLHGTFAVLAERQGIYKIESLVVGYIAVCGIPEPRTDHEHANIVEFAANLLTKVTQLLEWELRTRLGQGTKELKLRIGLHSGPTTAGLLRSHHHQHASFQLLYGETVHTACCLERTGRGNWIQISERTARLLELTGNCHWVMEKRANVGLLVNVPGIGEMETFWICPTAVTKNTWFLLLLILNMTAFLQRDLWS